MAQPEQALERAERRYTTDPRGAAEARVSRLETRLAEQGDEDKLAALGRLRERLVDDFAAQLVVQNGYDHFIVGFSGGKDSVACVLQLLELGVPAAKIELWHHEIDGREGSTLMDWPCTRGYVTAFARAFGMPLYFSWREGGFEREMLRAGSRTAPVRFETPEGSSTAGGTRGPLGTRRRFPQTSPDLSVRWCSGAIKIDVGDSALRNQERFRGKRTLVLTGERAEESAHRAHYAFFERDRTDAREGRLQRLVDHCRLVHAWEEHRVWGIIQQYGVNPHPAYRLGWGRVSCAACIFGNRNQWASLRQVNPAQFERVAAYEVEFGATIKHKLSVVQEADRGTPYPDMKRKDIAAATSHRYDEPIILPPGAWSLPAGAYGDSNGPI